MISPTVLLYKNKWRDRWETRYSLTDPESNWQEVWIWCLKTFGPPNEGVWGYHGGWLYFYNEKCVTLYLLRWS